MFRVSLVYRLSLLATSLPPHFTSSADIAFYFPRFQPSTHVQSAGIPEIEEALSLLSSQTVKVILPPKADVDQSHWRQREDHGKGGAVGQSHRVVESKKWLGVGKSHSSSVKEKTKCLQLIDRGIAILESAGGLDQSAIRDVLVPLYATKWELLQGTAHLPRPTFDYAVYASSPKAKGSSSVWNMSTCYRGGVLHVPKHILHQTSRVLLSDEKWSLEKGGSLSSKKIDTDCMILAHFVKAFALLHPRPFNQSSKKSNPSASPAAISAGIQNTQRVGVSIKSSRSSSSTSSSNTSSSSMNNNNHDRKPVSYSISSKSNWSLPIEKNGGGRVDVMTLEIALERTDQLIERCKAAIQELKKNKEAKGGQTTVAAPCSEMDSDTWESWKLYIPKLLLLKAILTIGCSGHLLHAKKCVDEAASYVHSLKKRSHVLLDGLREGERPAEPELGIFMLAQAEMMARIWDWEGGKLIPFRRQGGSATSRHSKMHTSISSNTPGGEESRSNAMVAELDEDVFDAFDNSAGFYAAPFTSNIKADGIMDVSLVAEREFEVHAYAVCVLSLATVILGVPRVTNTANAGTAPLFSSHASDKGMESAPMFSALHQDSKPVFLPQQLFSLFPPFLSLDRPSLITFSDSSRLRPFSIEEARRMAGVLLKRALELVRSLYPDDRDHPLAVQILTVMACLYADTRDYLYASGLFESARRGTYMHYGGPRSIEGIFVDKLRYEFLAGVGSEEEAKTAGHEIVQHLKEVDELPAE